MCLECPYLQNKGGRRKVCVNKNNVKRKCKYRYLSECPYMRYRK